MHRNHVTEPELAVIGHEAQDVVPWRLEVGHGARRMPVFERDTALRSQVFRLFSTSHSPESQAATLKDLLCCLPRIQSPDALRYDQVFRVLIMAFADAWSFDLRSVKKSCVHIIQPDGRIIPFDTFNLFYRDERARSLATIRARLDAFHAGAANA